MGSAEAKQNDEDAQNQSTAFTDPIIEIQRSLKPRSEMELPQERLEQQAKTHKSSRKLTPLQKRERDRERKREQAQRRRRAEQELWDQAKQLEKAQQHSSTWHDRVREEEELLLLRLDRDAVDAQRSHPAAAGYAFKRNDIANPKIWSPVFGSRSHALCPPTQDAAEIFRRSTFTTGSSSVSSSLKSAPVAAFWHPSCLGYSMARFDDCTTTSPIFFYSAFAKISFNEVAASAQENAQNETVSEGEDSGEDEQPDGHLELGLLPESERRRIQAIANRIRSMSKSTSNPNSAHFQPRCLVCNQVESSVGCPGCFEFSKSRFREAEASLLSQRLRTPKTKLQEAEERLTRHKFLFLQKQLIIPPLLLKRHRPSNDALDSNNRDSTSGRPSTPVSVENEKPSQNSMDEYYLHVLPDAQAIRKYRAISKRFVTLHIKSLPVGNIITLKVDVETTIASVYELFRANCDQPNRPIHLLLPTTRGLFQLSEQVADATDTRMGVVRGYLRINDFNLQSSISSRPSTATRPSSASLLTTNGEFMLFAVAVLNPSSTPQLVANYMTQNFRFASGELPLGPTRDEMLPLLDAACRLPEAVDRDACQMRLLPRVRDIQVFGRVDRELTAAERRNEREQMLRAAHLEAKLARLEQKRVENKRRNRGGGDEDDGIVVSTKVRRAVAYLEFVVGDAGNNHERLEKLWQLGQMLEEWKICKGGRLIDAERNSVTSSLVQRFHDATVHAFSCVVSGIEGRSAKAKSAQHGPLAFPIVCLGRADNPKLAIRLGTRLGISTREDVEFGLVLALDQDFDALDAEEKARVPKGLQATRKRGYTSKALLRLDQDENVRKQNEAIDLAVDCEWRAFSASTSASLTLVSGSDLLRLPFLKVRWLPMARAYVRVLHATGFQLAKLDEFNALAGPLQDVHVIMSSAQLEVWRANAEQLAASLKAGSALAQAAQRVLGKKGAAALKRRSQQRRQQQRRQQQREREQELEALRARQAALELPKVRASVALKRAFAAAEAPKVRALLEPTPTELLAARAGQLLRSAGAQAARAARAARKDLAVRAL